MELDDMQKMWAAHGVALERSLAINERLLRETMLRKTRIALAPHVVWRALEVAAGAAALLLVMPVLVAHITEPRYLVAAGALAIFTIAITAHCVYLLAGALVLDYGGPITAIQRDVERLRLVEYRATKWAILGGTLVWLPAILVFLEALGGIPLLARVDLAWLAANLAVGFIILIVGHAWLRHNVERPDLGPRARRIVDALSGRSLRRAAAHLAELATFERDESPA